MPDGADRVAILLKKLHVSDPAAVPKEAPEVDRLKSMEDDIRATLGSLATLVAAVDSMTQRCVEAIEKATVLLASSEEAVSRAKFVLSESEKGFAEMIEELRRPVEPIYDAKGKLIGARRVDKLK